MLFPAPCRRQIVKLVALKTSYNLRLWEFYLRQLHSDENLFTCNEKYPFVEENVQPNGHFYSYSKLEYSTSSLCCYSLTRLFGLYPMVEQTRVRYFAHNFCHVHNCDTTREIRRFSMQQLIAFGFTFALQERRVFLEDEREVEKHREQERKHTNGREKEREREKRSIDKKAEEQ